MCNLYNITTNQQAIRDFVTLTHDSLGNLEPSLDVYPDRPAPVVRNIGGGRELAALGPIDIYLSQIIIAARCAKLAKWTVRRS